MTTDTTDARQTENGGGNAAAVPASEGALEEMLRTARRVTLAEHSTAELRAMGVGQ